MRELSSHVEIEAPAEHVWEVLTDFAAYPEWNPFLRYVDGELQGGAPLEVRLRMSGPSGSTCRGRVLETRRNRGMTWEVQIQELGMRMGEYSVEIDPLDSDRVRLTQRLLLSAPAASHALGRGLETMNRALKERVE